jgi:hypothetical protein
MVGLPSAKADERMLLGGGGMPQRRRPGRMSGTLVWPRNEKKRLRRTKKLLVRKSIRTSPDTACAGM